MKKNILILILGILFPLSACEPATQEEVAYFSKIESAEKTPLSEEAKKQLIKLLQDDSNFDRERIKRCPFIAKYQFTIGERTILVSPSGNQLKIQDEVRDYEPMNKMFNTFIKEIEAKI